MLPKKGMSDDVKVRVLYLTSSLTVGGAERLMIDLFRHYSTNHLHSTLELYYVVMNDLVDEDYRQELLATGATGWFLERKQGNKSLKYVSTLNKIVRNHKIDIVHTHTTGSKYWGGVLKLLNPGLKLLYTVHSTFDVTRYRGIKLWLHRAWVDWNIAISNAVIAQCRHKGISKASVVYNGIEIAKFKTRQGREFPADPKLVCVSRLVPRIKGQDIIVDAAALCVSRGMPLSVTLVGDIGGRYKAAYEALCDQVNKHGLPEETIRFVGRRIDIHELLAEFDGYICASRKEGLGLSLIEAMATGLPVISSNTDGPAELVRDGENGFLFQSESAESLADTVLRVYRTMPQEAIRQVVVHARHYAQGFDISMMYQAYIDVYQSLLRPS